MRIPAAQAPLKVACFVPAFNAGETTRGLELCRGLAAAGLELGREVNVRVAYPTSDRDYEPLIRASGLEAQRLDLHLDRAAVSAIMAADHSAAEFVSDLDTARRFIRAVMDEITAWGPHLILCGFVPPVAIAAKILHVPSVVYLPFPAYRPWVRRHLLTGIPDDLENAATAAAPQAVRRILVKLLSTGILRTAFFRQPTFAAAGRALGWRNHHSDLIAMLAAPLQLVPDLPSFYQGQDVGPFTRITGALCSDSYSSPAERELPPDIRQIFAPGPRNRIFVAMGSSGEKACLLAALAAVSAMPVRAVAVVPPHICSLSELRQRVRIPAHVVLTDRFIPARQVNSLADVAIVHGGQGTVQTAISAGTPIVGVGMQVEQCTNLHNVVRRGAAIRLPKRDWTPDRIQEAVRRVLDVPSFAQSAARLQSEANAINGRHEAAHAIWNFVTANGL